MTRRRFGRLTNAYSKTLPNHAAAVSLHIAFYNLCRVHEQFELFLRRAKRRVTKPKDEAAT